MAEKNIVSCPNCSTKMSVPSDYIGLEGHCPKCRRSFVMNPAVPPPVAVPRAAAQPPAIPASAATPGASVKSKNMRVAGWVCFAVGMVLLVLCPILPFYSPFFLASFVLAIVLLVRAEGRGGLALLLTTILVPSAVGAIIFVLGVGAMMAAFTGFVKEVESSHKALVAQQQEGMQTPLSGQPTQLFQPATPVQKPAAQPLPAREVSYDGLLTVLNKYSDEYKRATTTVQKKDVRGKAQKEVAAFVENARMTLEGKVRDVQFGDDGKAGLLFSDFAAPGSAVQANRNLSASSAGKLPVPITREEALAIKRGQKVSITGRPFVVARDNYVVTMLDEGMNPSLITFRFLLDIETLMTLRMRDYTVSFDEKRVQAVVPVTAVPVKKNSNYLIVVPPKAGP
jgi:hypothetical protein